MTELNQAAEQKSPDGEIEKTIDTLVVGAGQAGVAMSEHLSKHGVPHLVLERKRIAEAWRTVVGIRWLPTVRLGMTAFLVSNLVSIPKPLSQKSRWRIILKLMQRRSTLLSVLELK